MLQLGLFLFIASGLVLVLNIFAYYHAGAKEQYVTNDHDAWHNLCKGASSLYVSLSFGEKFDCK
jgi:hypothetical protein